ncbi:MAG: hypothetical protein ACK5HS_03395 [Mycoplasmatales bacterium]
MNKKIIGLIFILFVITTGCSKETNIFEGNLDFDTLIEKHKDDYSQQLGYKYFLMSPSPNDNEGVEDIYKLNSYLIKVTNEREIVNIYTLDQYYDIFDLMVNQLHLKIALMMILWLTKLMIIW